MRLSVFKQLLEKFVDYRRDKRNQEFREFMDVYYAAHAWTLLKCPMCSRPATAPDAKFCVSCGASMAPSTAFLHPAFHQERITGPVQLVPGQRFLDYVHERHQDTGPNTKLHRAIQKEKAHHS